MTQGAFLLAFDLLFYIYMKNAILIALILSLPGYTVADEWRTSDTLREAAFLTLMAVDCSQSLNIRHIDTIHESNPILGAHPTDSEIVSYFATVSAVHLIGSYLLPHDWREWFQMITIGVQINTVTRNIILQGGLHLTF